MAKKLLVSIDNGYKIVERVIPINGDESEEELDEMASEIFWEQCDYDYKVIEDNNE